MISYAIINILDGKEGNKDSNNESITLSDNKAEDSKNSIKVINDNNNNIHSSNLFINSLLFFLDNSNNII